MASTPEDYLLRLGTGDVVHNSGDMFYQHLTGVRDVSRSLGADDELQLAALFHSIYGTEGFQAFTVPLEKRQEIRQVIGNRAELVAYANCVMDRATLDASLDDSPGSHSVKAREEVGGHTIALSDSQFQDLISIHLADWLQQVEKEAAMTNQRHGWYKVGDAWAYRRSAYRRMAEKLGGSYLQLYQQVFAREPEATRHMEQKFTPPPPSSAKIAVR